MGCDEVCLCSLPADVSIVFVDTMESLEQATLEMLNEPVLGWDSEYSHGNNVFCTTSLIQIAGRTKM